MREKKIVSIIGGNGFIGKYLVNNLTKRNFYVNIISRNPHTYKKIQVQPKLGQISLKSCDIKDRSKLLLATKGSEYVFNLTGLLIDKKKNSFNNVHVLGTENLVSVAKENKVKRIIHLSAIGAAKDTLSKYSLTKYLGESNIKQFQDYLIIRPSIVYGDEDNFINLFAKMSQFSPILPLVGGGQTKFQPIWVEDLVKIIMLLSEKSNFKNKIVEIGGNQLVTFEQIIKFILKEIGLKRYLLKIPFSQAKKIAFFLEKMPKSILTRDQVEMLKKNNIMSKKNSYKNFINYNPQDLYEMLARQLILYKKGGGHYL